MVDREGTRYLTIFSLNPCSEDRLIKFVPQAKDHLQKLSTEPIELVLRSVNGDLFAYLVRSKLRAPQISARLESPGDQFGGRLVAPFLTGSDGLLILEVGGDFSAGKGFTRVGTWLQRH